VAASDPAALYLELLKECLLGRVYGPEHTVTEDTYEFGRNFGAAFPERAATMIGRMRLNNLHGCVERATQDGVPGDLIETGVWRGGVPILMRAIVKARGEDRLVWVADSFAGLPDPDLSAYPLDREFVATRSSTSGSTTSGRSSSVTGCSTTACGSWRAGSRTRFRRCPAVSSRSPVPRLLPGGDGLPRRPRHHRADRADRLDRRLLAEGELMRPRCRFRIET